MPGILYLVSTPIGNYDEITLRAVSVLKEVNLIVCEEFREANRLLAHLQIQKKLTLLNEHSKEEESMQLLLLLLEGKNLALISDCGTPVFSDPGLDLVNLCIRNKVKVTPVAGANSLLPSLITSGFNLNSFYYAGWLSPKKDIRRKELHSLRSIKNVIVLMDTPYRLRSLLIDVKSSFGSNTPVSLAYEISTPKELFLHGSISEVSAVADSRNLKGEFVLIINNRK
ncbi:MAG TPA: 16S rRNA (cytidine(1402)-2'-O)-methyltransferase [Ignavibacteriaceae bacterium]|nr:16S rRNA (cytidine(1402)-2'-O)-methyltransferase [Ignavibacteriaceae bacterium]